MSTFADRALRGLHVGEEAPDFRFQVFGFQRQGICQRLNVGRGGPGIGGGALMVKQ